MTLEPCLCGQPSVRLIAAIAHCHECAEAFLEPIRARVKAREIEPEPGIGFGHQTGPLRPDWGDGWAEIRCDVCDATWVGPIGEYCGWCERWIELANETQRTRILWPELPDPQDERHDQALRAWAERLATAELADIVTPREAGSAWKRQVHDVAV